MYFYAKFNKQQTKTYSESRPLNSHAFLMPLTFHYPSHCKSFLNEQKNKIKLLVAPLRFLFIPFGSAILRTRMR